MGEQPKDGGPAFPIVKVSLGVGENTIKANEVNGMSLRDWFAGQAISWVSEIDHVDGDTATLDDKAKAAYELADAMLKERGKLGDEAPAD